MKSSKLFLTSLLAAAAMSATAYADDVALTNGEQTALTISSGVAGAGNTYTYTAPEEGTTDNGGWLWLGNLQGTGNVALGSAESNMALSGSGLIVLGYQGGDASAPTYTFDFANTDASAFSGKFAVVNEWNNSTVAKLSGTGWSNVEYVFAGVSREQNWVTKRMYNDTSRGYDTLALQGATTLAGITGTSKGYVPTGAGVAAGIGNINLREAVTVATSGTVLTLAGAGTYEFYGKVGTASEKVGIAKTGTGTQVLGGTLYLGAVTVSGGTLDLSGANVTLASAIANSGTVSVNANTIFVLSDSLKVGDTGNTYSLISGGNITDWSTLTASNFRIGSGPNSLRGASADVSTDGQVDFTAGTAANLTWKAGTSGTWDVQTTQNWTNDSTSADDVFYDYDSVKFATTGAVEVSVASTGVSAGTVTITAGTVSFSGGAITAQDGVFVAGTSAESIATLKLAETGGFAAGTVITVGEHGVFDIVGKSDTEIGLVLGGGTLTNTGNNVNGGNKQFTGGLSLTANSKVTAAHNISFVNSGYNAQTFDFGGFTLTKDGAGTLSFVNTTIQNGTLRVTEGTFDSISAPAIAAEKKRITLGENSRIEVVENGVMNATIASMGAGSSLKLAGTGASAVTLNGAIGANAIVNVSGNSTVSGTISDLGNGAQLTLNGTNASTLTLKHGHLNRSASISIAAGSKLIDTTDYKNYLYLSGNLSGAGTLASYAPRINGQYDYARVVKLSGNTSGFTGKWTLDTLGDSVTNDGVTTSGNHRVYGVLNSADSKFGGVISFTENLSPIETESRKTAVVTTLEGAKLLLLKDMEIGGLQGSLSNTAVAGITDISVNDSSGAVTVTYGGARALTINTAANANYDYAGKIEASIASITKKGSGTQILSGDNSAYTGTVTLEAGTLGVGHANALGTSAVNVMGDSTLEVGSELSVGNAVTVAADKKLTLKATGSTLNGAISGDGSLKVETMYYGYSGSDEVVTLAGGNTLAGTLEVEGVKLNVSALGTGTLKIADYSLTISGTTTTARASVNATAANVVLHNVSLLANNSAQLTAETDCSFTVAEGATLYLDISALGDDVLTGDSVALTIAAASAFDNSFFSAVEVGTYGEDGSWVKDLQWAYVEGSWNVGAGTLSIAIPEPSVFGLLAGLGALALAGTRRRRKKA